MKGSGKKKNFVDVGEYEICWAFRMSGKFAFLCHFSFLVSRFVLLFISVFKIQNIAYTYISLLWTWFFFFSRTNSQFPIVIIQSKFYVCRRESHWTDIGNFFLSLWFQPCETEAFVVVFFSSIEFHHRLCPQYDFFCLYMKCPSFSSSLFLIFTPDIHKTSEKEKICSEINLHKNVYRNNQNLNWKYLI